MMCNKLLLIFLVIVEMGWALEACAQSPKESDYYRIATFPTPEGAVLEAGAFHWLSDGRLAIATRRGEIWIIANPNEEDPSKLKWSRFAHGLHEPLGLAERDGWLYATQRSDVTRMRDADGDSVADEFEIVGDGWEISGDYHEYAVGSKFDRQGDLWVVLCLTGSFGSDVPFRGWCVRVDSQGKTIPTAYGIRSPGGIGFNADGDVFYTDNQGPWNGTCGLKHLVPGKFAGHPGGNKWFSKVEAWKDKTPVLPANDSRMAIEAQKYADLVPTAVFFPYGKMGQSASGIACDQTKGKFGPFAGQLFVGDQTHSTIMRVDLEKVKGVYQGACFPFRSGFQSGVVGVELAPDGTMFVGGTNRGWGSRGPRDFAVERLEWTGVTPFEIHTMRVQPDGFLLTFTRPVDVALASKVERYAMETYTYIYREQYGSPEVDHTHPTIQQATVSNDGLQVRLRVHGMQIGHIHELKIDGLQSQSGEPLLHPQAYYTLNSLP